MILADTNIWIDHFRRENVDLLRQLERRFICMHAFVAGELAIGPLRNRKRTLGDFALLPQAPVASMPEVMQMIEDMNLYNRGLGLIDVHLIASCLLERGSLSLWTRDKQLADVADTLGILSVLL